MRQSELRLAAPRLVVAPPHQNVSALSYKPSRKPSLRHIGKVMETCELELDDNYLKVPQDGLQPP